MLFVVVGVVVASSYLYEGEIIEEEVLIEEYPNWTNLTDEEEELLDEIYQEYLDPLPEQVELPQMETLEPYNEVLLDMRMEYSNDDYNLIRGDMLK